MITITSIDVRHERACGLICYGIAESSVGTIFIALLGDTLCFLAFKDTADDAVLADLKALWPHSVIRRDDAVVARWLAEHNSLRGEVPALEVLVRGTPLQVAVWRTLSTIPRGSTMSYSDLAKAVGLPRAVRAVASACAKNNVAYLIPCHRIIKKDGSVHRYRWGAERKIQLRLLEFAS